MATTTDLPVWAMSTKNQIEALGFKWKFDWEYPVPSPETTRRVQIRDETHVGQKSEVSQYAEAMKRGDKFPPGVVTKDGRIVDFNTRSRAAHKLGWPTFPVFIIQEDFEGADELTRQRFRLLGAAFNTGGPKSLTRAELSDIIRDVAASPGDWDTNKVSEHLHVPRGTVNAIFAQYRAEKRAELLGVSFNGTVTSSARATLGQRSEKLADKPFREITKLVQEAGMSTSDVADLCKRVIDVTTGDEDRLTLIQAEREARDQQIAGYKASGKRRPPLSSRVRTYAEFFVSHKDKVSELVDTNPNTRGDFLAMINEAHMVLSHLVTAQRESGV
jgi:hypothetical protein